MPGPSFAPIFAAFGAFLLFLGLVFGGIALILGAIALVLTLLYWLAEGLRIYDHDIAPTATVLPGRHHAGPPPGVHVPGPSWRPIVGALGTALLFLGLVFGEWLLAAGRDRPDRRPRSAGCPMPARSTSRPSRPTRRATSRTSLRRGSRRAS